MPRKHVVVAIAVAAMLVAPVAMARSIFLNGIDISELKSRTFKNADVFIDHNGDIHLTAKGYKVEVIDQEPTAVNSNPNGGANPALSTRFYLATSPSSGGNAQYDIVIAVNGVERKVIKAGSPAEILEVSAWLKKGENKIDVIAKKNITGGRKSVSAADEASVILGAGHESGAIVKIDVVHVSFKCNAAQISTVKKRYTINAI